MKFEVFEDMTKIKDSMQLESGTEIATLKLDNGKIATIEVRGDVKVFWENEESPYRNPSEFPKPLKDLIANDNMWYSDPRVYVGENNWFEMFYDGNNTFVDNCECVDIEKATPKEIYGIIANVVNDEEGEYILPKTYEEFCKSNEVILRYEESKKRVDIER